jgi:energy-coupling factor transporter ATP-binding protein EcfA2
MEFHKCPQIGCDVQLDGKCLEGHEITACPYYNEYIVAGDSDDNDDENESADDKDDSTEGNLEVIKIQSSNALNIEESNVFLRANETNLVVLAGKDKCGKTTIIATLIQLFQEQNGFEQFQFASSKSLIGFEQRCHPSRMESEGSEEKTTRTPVLNIDDYASSQTFLQLTLRKNNKIYHFLIADISGEVFDALTASTEACKKLAFLKRCDNFSLIFDVSALIEMPKRATVKTKTISILRSLIDADMISRKTHIQILFSKWDVIDNIDNKETHEQYINAIRDSITKEFGSSYPQLTFINVAARPKFKSAHKLGYGIDELLTHWSISRAFSSVPLVSNDHQVNNKRELLNFKFVETNE